MRYGTTSVILLVLVVMAACDTTESATNESEIDQIRIMPRTAEIPVGDQVDFSLVALSANGDTLRDANLEIRWWSSDSTVFVVAEDGVASAVNDGSAFCMVEAIEQDGSAGKRGALFTGRDSAFVRVVRF